MILLTALVYVADYLGFGTLVAVLRQLEIASNEAEVARKESEKLLAELQIAHEQLQVYTVQAEELAVAAERNRMARELHDSVTQSLHSSTLMAAAGQRLADEGDLERTKHYLTRLGEISQQALKEMRLMVYELRPLALRQVGLAGALQHGVKGQMVLWIALIAVPFGLVGTYFGMMAGSSMQSLHIRRIFGVLMLLIGIKLLLLPHGWGVLAEPDSGVDDEARLVATEPARPDSDDAS